jgi:hypothetical protein
MHVIPDKLGDVIPNARDLLPAASGVPEKISRSARDGKRMAGDKPLRDDGQMRDDERPVTDSAGPHLAPSEPVRGGSSVQHGRVET